MFKLYPIVKETVKLEVRDQKVDADVYQFPLESKCTLTEAGRNKFVAVLGAVVREVTSAQVVDEAGEAGLWSEAKR